MSTSQEEANMCLDALQGLLDEADTCNVKDTPPKLGNLRKAISIAARNGSVICYPNWIAISGDRKTFVLVYETNSGELSLATLPANSFRVELQYNWTY